MKNDLISVLIPSYNHDRYIIECINSIIGQTYKHVELIIIDDGSSDNTNNKIDSIKPICEKRFTKFLYIKHRHNKGIIETESEFLNYARGEFLFKIASDDVIKENNAIELMHKFLSKNKNYGLVVGDNNFIDSDSKECFVDRNGNLFYQQNNKNYNSFIDLLLSNRKDMSIGSKNFGSYSSILRGNYITNGLLIRKEVYSKIEDYNIEAPLEDWFLMLQLTKYYKIKFINKKLCSYRKHKNSASANNQDMRLKIKRTAEYEKKILEQPKYKKYKKFAQKYYVGQELKIPFIFSFIKQKNFYKKRKIFLLFGVKIYEKLY